MHRFLMLLTYEINDELFALSIPKRPRSLVAKSTNINYTAQDKQHTLSYIYICSCTTGIRTENCRSLQRRKRNESYLKPGFQT